MCFGRVLENGQPCPYEIKSGPKCGECGKPCVKECPDNETEDEDVET